MSKISEIWEMWPSVTSGALNIDLSEKIAWHAFVIASDYLSYVLFPVSVLGRQVRRGEIFKHPRLSAFSADHRPGAGYYSLRRWVSFKL